MKVRTRQAKRLALRHLTVNTKPKRKKAPNPLRLDPTRTLSLRKAWVADLRRRFARVKGLIVKLVVDKDFFDLRERKLGMAALHTNSNDFFARCDRDEGGRCVAEGGAVSTAEFKAWFGKSKVLGASGKPLVVYHGATQSFDEFRENTFFTDKPDVAGGFAIRRQEHAGEEDAAARTIAAYVRIEKPLVIDAKGKPAGEIQFARNDMYGYRAGLKSSKHDGIIIKNTSDEGTLYIPRNPNQIKSAYGNSGKFDRSDPVITNAGPWAFQPDPRKVQLFLRWLKAAFDRELFDGRGEDADNAYWRRYIEQGWQKGGGRAYDDWRRANPEIANEPLDFYRGTRDNFVKSSFGAPESVEKVKMLAGRSFHDLEGITQSMSTRISRALTDGLVQGMNPLDIARDLTEQVDIDRPRAEMMARSELIRAHAEGQLSALEDLGVEEVGVAVEWTVTDDEVLCPRCAVLEGVVMSIEDAHGKIPLHVNCRCSFIPANVAEDQDDQKRSRKEVEGALEEADVEDWDLGAAPKPLLNELRGFSRLIGNSDGNCGTGAGGFQPGNTCAKGSDAGAILDAMPKLSRTGKPKEDGQYVANPVPRSSHEDKMEVALARELEKAGMTGTEYTKQFATEEVLPTELLESGQTIVKVDSVKHFVEYGSEAHYSDKPLVVQYGGRYIIRDGNHRLAAELLKGKDKVKVRVLYVPGG